MNFDKIFEVYVQEEISDNMGGFELNQKMVGNIRVFTSPVTAELMLKEYGVVSNSAMKIFTKNYLPTRNDVQGQITLRYADRKNNVFIDYEIIQMADYGKYRMMLVQVI